MKFAALTLAGLLFAAACNAAEPAPTPARGQVVTIGFRGQITRVMLDRFVAAVQNVHGDPFPAGLIINIDSPGGDGMIGMQIGRLAREHKAHVFVQGRCSSACIFVLAGGVVRNAPDGAIGIHRGTLMVTRPGQKSAPVDPSAPGAKTVLELAERETDAYFEEMGMPPELWQAMKAVPNNEMRRLSRAEATQLGLVGVDPDYARERAAASNSRVGHDPHAFAARALDAQATCPVAEPPREFIACYSKALQPPPVQRATGR
jgi:ATP-dependent protease ClpP protease subunit